MELATRKTVGDLVQSYEQAIAMIDRIEAISKELDAEVKSSTLKSPYLFNRMDYELREGRKNLKDHYWRHVLQKLEFTRFASVKAAKDVENLMRDNKMPEVSVLNIENFANNYLSNIQEIFKESVAEVFNFLRPRSRDHKTNKIFEIGPKIILVCALEVYTYSKRYQMNYYRKQEFVSLERVCRNLEGKGAVEHYKCELDEKISETSTDSNGKGETEYFKFRCFKNRNLHLEFKESKLGVLKQINMIGSEKMLKTQEIF